MSGRPIRPEASAVINLRLGHLLDIFGFDRQNWSEIGNYNFLGWLGIGRAGAWAWTPSCLLADNREIEESRFWHFFWFRGQFRACEFRVTEDAILNKRRAEKNVFHSSIRPPEPNIAVFEWNERKIRSSIFFRQIHDELLLRFRERPTSLVGRGRIVSLV